MKNYFYTWAPQNNAFHFPISGCTEFHYQSEGKNILDFCSISFHAGFGLKNDLIIKAITKQLNRFPQAGPKVDFDLKTLATEKLINYLDRQGKIFYTVSGAESIENALKMARFKTQRKIILSRRGEYHGATLGAISISDGPRNRDNMTVDDWTVFLPSVQDDPECEQLEKIILETGPENIAAICVETFLGGGGIHSPTPKWFSRLQEMKEKYDLLVIMDEVVYAFGRSGTALGIDHYPELKPDFICMAKMISGGHIPFGAVWTTNEIHQYFTSNSFACGLTNYAHPLGLAAMNAVLDICGDANFQKDLESKIIHFQREVEKLKCLSFIQDIRSIGLIACIDLKNEIPLQSFLDRHIFVYYKGKQIILAPALTMPIELIDSGIKYVKQTIEESS